MTPSVLSPSKKQFEDLGLKKNNEKRQFVSPIDVEKDKNRKEQSLQPLLEICKKGLIHTLHEEKSLFIDEENEEKIPLKKSEPEPSPFALSGTFIAFTSAPIIESVQTSFALSEIPNECLEVFDKLCGEMLIMDSESCLTTTFILETEAFENSPFYGAKITISEYSTAPKVFNVSISTTDPAAALLQTNMAQFFELLETRNFSFGIHRIDTDVSSDSWLAKDLLQDDNQDSQDKEDS